MEDRAQRAWGTGILGGRLSGALPSGEASTSSPPGRASRESYLTRPLTASHYIPNSVCAAFPPANPWVFPAHAAEQEKGDTDKGRLTRGCLAGRPTTTRETEPPAAGEHAG